MRPRQPVTCNFGSWRGGLEPPTCCLQDSGEPSTGYWPVLSWQLRSGGSSSQCAPVGLSDAWWNDKRNDIAPRSTRLDQVPSYSEGQKAVTIRACATMPE